jgi:hypothetical protein
MHVSKRFLLAGLVALVLALVPDARAAVCPFNIPVVTIPPHQQGGFSWGTVIRPMGDACISSIAVEPANDPAWYAGGVNGLFMTKNNGLSWTKPLGGNVGPLLIVPAVPGSPQLVYAGVGSQLYLSRDHGSNWASLHTFPTTVRSLLVANGTLFVGLQWSSHAQAGGVFTSSLGAGFVQFHPFGPGQTGLIVWTLARDPLSGAIYAGTEIFDHPQPYHPPFFRSLTNGSTWTNVAGTIPWHVVASAVRPNDGYVYALTEGSGVYGSANQGGIWQGPVSSPGLGLALLMDPLVPTRLYAGRQFFGTLKGGIFRSNDAGKTFQPIGLPGVTVSGIAVNGARTRMYASTYGSGIYTSPVP